MRSHANLIKNFNDAHLLFTPSFVCYSPHDRMVALNPKPTVSQSPATQTFMTRKPMQTDSLIYLPSPNRSASKVDSRGKIMWWPQDEECSSFVQPSSWLAWNHLLICMQAPAADWKLDNRGECQSRPALSQILASSLMTDFAYSAANLKDNKSFSLQKAFNNILVCHPSYNKHLSVCTNSVSICVPRSCNCLDIVTVHEASEGRMFQTSITAQEAFWKGLICSASAAAKTSASAVRLVGPMTTASEPFRSHSG